MLSIIQYNNFIYIFFTKLIQFIIKIRFIYIEIISSNLIIISQQIFKKVNQIFPRYNFQSLFLIIYIYI